MSATLTYKTDYSQGGLTLSEINFPEHMTLDDWVLLTSLMPQESGYIYITPSEAFVLFEQEVPKADWKSLRAQSELIETWKNLSDRWHHQILLDSYYGLYNLKGSLGGSVPIVVDQVGKRVIDLEKEVAELKAINEKLWHHLGWRPEYTD